MTDLVQLLINLNELNYSELVELILAMAVYSFNRDLIEKFTNNIREGKNDRPGTGGKTQ